jgi:predicted nucleic acid-binding protein
MSVSEQRSDAPVVADTVVVNYFLAVGEISLLAELCGGIIHIPRAVFDPDEPDDAPEEALSELRRGLHLHRRRVADAQTSEPALSRSQSALPHFEQLPTLTSGPLRVVEPSDDELILFSSLRDSQAAPTYGLVAPLGAGESAALAVAAQRGWRLATDDQDAVNVAARFMPEWRPLRIRALLRAAADDGLVTIERAREIHQAMKAAGFWDSGTL